MTAHSILSPSAAARWTRCPASVSLCAQLGDTAGRDADEGTLAHELAAALLMSPAQRCARLDSDVRPGQLPRMPDDIRADLTARGFDADAVEADVGLYVGFCRSLPGIEVERPLRLRDGMGAGYTGGTADAVADLDDGLWVLDLKMGRRPVAARENRQLILYADAVLAEDAERGLVRPDAHPVHICIVQPRLRGSVETWQATAGEVRALAREFYAAGRRAFELVCRPELVQADDFEPGGHCLYCAAAGFCRALKNASLALASPDEDEPEGRVDRLDGAELARAWKALPMVEAWTKAVSAVVFARLSSGIRLPGLHLEPGKPGNRRWADAEKAEAWAAETFGEAAYDRSFKSVAQLEKACVKGASPEVQEAFAALIVRPPGALRVAEGDPTTDAAPSTCDGVFHDLFAQVAAPAQDAEIPAAKDEKPKSEKAPRQRRKVKKSDE